MVLFLLDHMTVQMAYNHTIASDSLRPWRYINLLTYLVTYNIRLGWSRRVMAKDLTLWTLLDAI